MEGDNRNNTSTLSQTGLRYTILQRSVPQKSKLPVLQPLQPRRVTFSKIRSVVYLNDIGASHRKGPWMRMALDRHRFKRRVDIAKTILDPILTKEHRERFLCTSMKALCVK